MRKADLQSIRLFLDRQNGYSVPLEIIIRKYGFIELIGLQRFYYIFENEDGELSIAREEDHLAYLQDKLDGTNPFYQTSQKIISGK